ncbi:MAG: cyanophycinase [Candidatus Limivicinus sp.]|jgi:cyanophycinase
MEGTLFVVGGGLKASADEVFSEFIKCAGGKNSRIAFASTASCLSPDELFDEFRSRLVKLGVPEENCVKIPLYAKHILDKDNFNAVNGDADGLCELMKGVSGVWFSGGDQRNIINAFLRTDGTDTRLMSVLREIYSHGGVIGGTSAGAAVMSHVMIGGGDNKGVLSSDVLYDYPEADTTEDERAGQPLVLTCGLGFFTQGIVDQHFNKRARLLRLIEACLSSRDSVSVGYGVSEDTALVLQGGTIKVLGSASVYIVDCRNAEKPGRGCYRNVKLSAVQRGDIYETKTGRIFFAAGEQGEKMNAGLDLHMNFIINSPEFDAMINDFVLCADEKSMLRQKSELYPYAAGGVVYASKSELYTVILRYHKTAETCGYRGRHTSFSGVVLDIDTAVARGNYL